MENQTKLYPSYMGEFYAANPVKFEKRKNNVKPMLYYGLAVVAVIIVIFPGFIPVAGWLVRTVGVIAVLICLLAAYLSNFDYYNSESGGKIKEVGLKKFKRDETDINRILEAFLRNRKPRPHRRAFGADGVSLCYLISAHTLQKWDFFFRGM